MSMTKEEIIQETVNYYSADTSRRGVAEIDDYDVIEVESTCLYYLNDDRMCAVGRCLLPEYQTKKFSFKHIDSSCDQLASIENKEHLDELLQPKYRGHGEIFWRYLQIFHDEGTNWTEDGLSQVGEYKLKRLKDTVFQ